MCLMSLFCINKTLQFIIKTYLDFDTAWILTDKNTKSIKNLYVLLASVVIFH